MARRFRQVTLKPAIPSETGGSMKYTLHYGGDAFTLDEQQAELVTKALKMIENKGVSLLLEFAEVDAERPATTHKFLFSAGVPIYLTQSI